MSPFELPERFWNKIDKRGADECWPWLASCNRKGYPQFRYNGKMRKAANLLLLSLGNSMHGLCARHSCDVPTCMNPAHLAPGTNAQNVADRVARGRSHHPIGSRNGRALLTDGQAASIKAVYQASRVNGRAKYGILNELAGLYEVSRNVIKDIVYNRNWTHL